jgi:hypothetical protein
MSGRFWPAAALAGLALSACAGGDGLRRYAVVQRADVWQAVIRDADRARLAGLAGAWEAALADVAAGNGAAALAALGAVAQERLAPEGVVPPRESAAADGAQALVPLAGAYRCRMIAIGWAARTPRTVPVVQAGDWQPCSVRADGVLARFEQAGGRERLRGTFFPDSARAIFLGSVRLADERGWHAYGEDGQRDRLGVAQPLSGGGWRVVMPWPPWTARLAILELRRDG